MKDRSLLAVFALFAAAGAMVGYVAGNQSGMNEGVLRGKKEAAIVLKDTCNSEVPEFTIDGDAYMCLNQESVKTLNEYLKQQGAGNDNPQIPSGYNSL